MFVNTVCLINFYEFIGCAAVIVRSLENEWYLPLL